MKVINFDSDDNVEEVKIPGQEPNYAPEEAEEVENPEKKEGEEEGEGEDEDESDKKPEAAGEGEDKKEGEGEEDKPVVFADAIKDTFGLEIEELTETLSDYKTLVTEVEDLRSQLENREPVFANDAQKKAYDFVMQAPTGDLSRLGEYAHLMAIDEDKMDDKDALKEEFVLRRPALGRAKAEKLFESSYAKKYSYDESDEDEEEVMKITIEDDARKAKDFIKEQKQKFTPAKQEQNDNKEVGVDEKVVSAAINQNVTAFESTLKGYQGVKLAAPDSKPENAFTFALSKDQEQEIKEDMSSVLANKSYYDPKTGKYKGEFQAEQSRDTLIWAKYGPEIVKAYGKHCENLGYGRRVNELEGKLPERQSSDTGGSDPEAHGTWTRARKR